jgi:hypothetical protein
MQDQRTAAPSTGTERFALSLALAVIIQQARRLPRGSGARRTLAMAAAPLRDGLETASP